MAHAKTQERLQLSALFELYEWRPMSVIWRRGPTQETLACRQSDGAIIRRVAGSGIFNSRGDKLARMTLRAPREWSDIPLPALRLMHARLLQHIAKECSDSKTEVA